MSVGAARRLVVGYGIAYVVALSFPGIVPSNRIRPMVLGMPFAMAWVAFWVLLGFVVLLVLDRAVSRAESARRQTRPDTPGAP